MWLRVLFSAEYRCCYGIGSSGRHGRNKRNLLMIVCSRISIYDSCCLIIIIWDYLTMHLRYKQLIPCTFRSQITRSILTLYEDLKGDTAKCPYVDMWQKSGWDWTIFQMSILDSLKSRIALICIASCSAYFCNTWKKYSEYILSRISANAYVSRFKRTGNT